MHTHTHTHTHTQKRCTARNENALNTHVYIRSVGPNRLEAEARAQKKGVWNRGANAESPAQYKARITKEKAEQFLAPTGG